MGSDGGHLITAASSTNLSAANGRGRRSRGVGEGARPDGCQCTRGYSTRPLVAVTAGRAHFVAQRRFPELLNDVVSRCVEHDGPQPRVEQRPIEVTSPGADPRANGGGRQPNSLEP